MKTTIQQALNAIGNPEAFITASNHAWIYDSKRGKVGLEYSYHAHRWFTYIDVGASDIPGQQFIEFINL